MQVLLNSKIEQFDLFPSTRYMGSKNKIISNIWEVIKDYKFNSFYDAFAGSNVVSYFLKSKGKQIITNDFMKMSYFTSKAIIENSFEVIDESDVFFLLNNDNKYKFVSNNFTGLYFDKSDNCFIEKIRYNIDFLKSEYKKAIALSALIRSCIKKRPRGIFTYIGERYDDGRMDVKKSIEDHFLENIKLFNNAVFDNGLNNVSLNVKTENCKVDNVDLVYLDPPYYSINSDNDYTRRYHFVEGLAVKWENLEIQEHTKTKKFKSYNSPFSNKNNAYSAFETLIKMYQESVILISYSSNSLPTKNEIIELLKKYKCNVDIVEIDHTYSFGNHNHKVGNNNNKVKEYLFISS